MQTRAFASAPNTLMRMNNSLLAFLLVSATVPVAHAAPLKPMNAVYSVVRDGKAVGDATYALNANADGSWTLHSVTKGSAGMARLLGLDVREESRFRWQDGKPEGLRYD